MLVIDGVHIGLADSDEVLRKHVMEKGGCSSLEEFVSYNCHESPRLGEVDESYLVELEYRRKRLFGLLRA